MEIEAKKIRDWRENVTYFAHDQFGFDPDKWQRDVFDVFPSQEPDKLRIAMTACVGPGKSFVLAVCGLNLHCNIQTSQAHLPNFL